MINPSESFVGSRNLCSLCERCIAENKSTRNWNCKDKDYATFANKNKIFYEGECLCGKNHNADCVYKYKNYKVIAIEIKDQPLNNIDSDNLAAKIENCYNCANSYELTLVAFVLQLSGIKNLDKEEYQLLEECEKGLRANNISIGKNRKLIIKKDGLKHTNIKFYIVKCKELNDKYFCKLLSIKQNSKKSYILKN